MRKTGLTRDHARDASAPAAAGPFEQKYEDCKAEVKVSFDHAKSKYKESLQKLIDDFGFNPTYKRWFDEF